MPASTPREKRPIFDPDVLAARVAAGRRRYPRGDSDLSPSEHAARRKKKRHGAPFAPARETENASTLSDDEANRLMAA